MNNRPLWYSAVVQSSMARVLSLDLGIIRQFLATLLAAHAQVPAAWVAGEEAEGGGGGCSAGNEEGDARTAQCVLSSVSVVDTQLYSCAVQQQAMAVQV